MHVEQEPVVLPPLTDAPVATSLQDWSLLCVHGDDAFTWLQGQLSNDLRPLHDAPQEAVYALVTSLTGGILADTWVFCSQGRYFLALPSETQAVVAAHFDRFLIMEDAEVEDMPGWQLLSWAGPGSVDLAQRMEAVLPEGTVRCHGRRLKDESMDLWIPAAEAATTVAALQEQLGTLGGRWLEAEAWEALRIARGVARFGADFDHRTLPQQASLKHAVHFGKGCYQGQEAVVMLEHRGKLSRKLYAMRWTAPTLPQASTPIETAGKEQVGRICSAACQGEHVYALGYVKCRHMHADARLWIDGQWPVEAVWDPEVQ